MPDGLLVADGVSGSLDLDQHQVLRDRWTGGRRRSSPARRGGGPGPGGRPRRADRDRAGSRPGPAGRRGRSPPPGTPGCRRPRDPTAPRPGGRRARWDRGPDPLRRLPRDHRGEELVDRRAAGRSEPRRPEIERTGQEPHRERAGDRQEPQLGAQHRHQGRPRGSLGPDGAPAEVRRAPLDRVLDRPRTVGRAPQRPSVGPSRRKQADSSGAADRPAGSTGREARTAPPWPAAARSARSRPAPTAGRRAGRRAAPPGRPPVVRRAPRPGPSGPRSSRRRTKPPSASVRYQSAAWTGLPARSRAWASWRTILTRTRVRSRPAADRPAPVRRASRAARRRRGSESSRSQASSARRPGNSPEPAVSVYSAQRTTPSRATTRVERSGHGRRNAHRSRRRQQPPVADPEPAVPGTTRDGARAGATRSSLRPPTGNPRVRQAAARTTRGRRRARSGQGTR